MAGNKIQGQEFIVVIIEQIDIANNIAHVRDKTNSPFMVFFRQHAAGVLHVPNVAERWTAKKIGNVWHLDQRLDSSAEQIWMALNMSAGDTKLYGNTLWIEADTIQINGRKIGPTVRDYFEADPDGPGFTSVTLASEPVAIETVQPFLQGSLCEPSLYTLSGRTLTFTTGMAGGHLVVYYQAINQLLDDEGVAVGRARISGLESYTV